MWTTIERGIESLIKEATGVQNVQLWSGKPEDILRKPTNYPAVRVLIEEHDLTPIDTTETSFLSKFSITCLVFFRSLREDGTGAYSIIQNLYKLNQTSILGYKLTPQGAQLLTSEAGEFIFAVKLKAEGVEILARTEDEPLHKQFDFLMEGAP